MNVFSTPFSSRATSTSSRLCYFLNFKCPPCKLSNDVQHRYVHLPYRFLLSKTPLCAVIDASGGHIEGLKKKKEDKENEEEDADDS